MMDGFLRVVPIEIERHGPAAACVLAYIRFRCSGRNSIQRGGYRWYRTSRQDIADDIGLPFKVVRKALEDLAGVVVSERLGPRNDRTLAYRVADEADSLTSDDSYPQPRDQAKAPQGLPKAPQGFSKSPTGPSGRPHRAFAPLYVEGEESERSGRAQKAAGKHPTRPSRFCDKHPNGYRGKCGDCGNARTAHSAWQAAAAEIDVALSSSEDFARRRRRQLIDACPDCRDTNGRIDADADGTPNPIGEFTVPCKHPNLRTADHG